MYKHHHYRTERLGSKEEGHAASVAYGHDAPKSGDFDGLHANVVILTESSSVALLASHTSTWVTTSMMSTSGTSSPDTSATRCSSRVASSSIDPLGAPSRSGGPATCSFRTRSGWNAFRQSGHALGERFRRHLGTERRVSRTIWGVLWGVRTRGRICDHTRWRAGNARVQRIIGTDPSTHHRGWWGGPRA